MHENGPVVDLFVNKMDLKTIDFLIAIDRRNKKIEFNSNDLFLNVQEFKYLNSLEYSFGCPLNCEDNSFLGILSKVLKHLNKIN